jgi:tRNA(Ile)-lysidine synthase
MSLEASVLRVVRGERLIEAGEKVLVGVSGGIDSTTLLFLLNQIKNDLPFSLATAHVNHRLRGAESERDENFVKGLADRLSLPFHVMRANVKEHSRESGISVQHAGRDIRYRFFEELAETHDYQKIAVGHNRDDQVETFLLRVVKGTGINGLSSIPIRRGRIIRPLLRSYRSEIEAYAAQFPVDHIEDSSNLKDTYERNFLRHRIVPLLEQLNPRFREKVLLLLSDIASINTVFDDEAGRLLERQGNGEGKDGQIGVDELKSLHREVRFRVVSRMLSRLEPRFTALREHILLVEKSMLSGRPNNTVTLPYGIRVRRVYGDLIFTKETARVPNSDIVEIHKGKNVIPSLGVTLEAFFTDRRPPPFPEDSNVAFFDAGKTVSGLTVRTFREGDRFVPLGMTQSVKLKDYFISRKVPREQRRHIPLLLSQGDIIWVIGERIDERYKVTGGTVRFLKVLARFKS